MRNQLDLSRVRRWLTCLALSGALHAVASDARADNPIVQTLYTADPAPLVYNDTVYLYTGHDEDTLVNNFFTMKDWRLYTSTDIVNWTDRGSPLKATDFTWASGDAWAGQVINRNNKFYYYVPITSRSLNRKALGVAVADTPLGPFKDPIGKPLVAYGGGDIDPTVFIDEDGQAYLYWGNPSLCYVKLNADMTSYSGSVVCPPMTTASFGTRTGSSERATLYEEGPWFYRRGSLYYLLYASDCCGPEKLDYSTSSSPTGTWTYRGRFMDSAGSASFTNHPGVIDFKGNSYLFYHNGALPGGSGYHRSVAVEQFKYNTDGTLPTIKMTSAGPNGVGNLNPYVQTEAETIAWESGIETEVCSEGGLDVTSINNGDYIKVKGVDFGEGATSFEARVASSASGSIELHLDSVTGTLIGTCAVTGTGSTQTWATKTCSVTGAKGIHDLFLRFTGGSGALFNFNWWRFVGSGTMSGSGGANGMAGAGAGGASGGASAGSAGTSTSAGGTSTGGTSASGGRLSNAGGQSANTGGVSSGGSSQGGTSSVGNGGALGSGGSVSAQQGGSGVGGTSSPGAGGSSPSGGTISPSSGGTASGGRSAGSTNGGAPNANGSSGCSCRTPSPNPNPKPLVLLFGAALLARRRRSRPS